MIFGSVCSGIEAASVAWRPLGWRAAWFSEIARFPSAVLAHHYPNTPNLGDMRRIDPSEHESIELLVGGTPCQSFSVAGLRRGLADPRGNLALTFLALADRARPRWVVWENVPGVLTTDEGRPFGAFLGGLEELGYGWSYRTLDAQYVRVDGLRRAVPQRRQRVFVVGYLGDWRRAAAVLFERACMSGNPAPRREAGTTVASLTQSGVGVGGPDDNQAQAGHLIAQAFNWQAGGNMRQMSLGEVVSALTAGQIPGVVQAFGGKRCSGAIDVVTAVLAGNRYDFDSETFVVELLKHAKHIVAGFKLGQGSAARSDGYEIGVAPTLTSSRSGTQQAPGVLIGLTVRRLTPRECERLQGFPDDYTRIPCGNRAAEQCKDTPRYMAIGNSMAVNVMRWIGQRIEVVDAIASTEMEATSCAAS